MPRSDPRRFDDLFTQCGPIVLKRFFGGEAIYLNSVMIGMVFDDRIYFKTDATTRKAFLAERAKPYSFKKRSTGETIVTGWYSLPDRLYDDPEELAKWARAAFAVASASPTTVGQRARRLGSSRNHPRGLRR